MMKSQVITVLFGTQKHSKIAIQIGLALILLTILPLIFKHTTKKSFLSLSPASSPPDDPSSSSSRPPPEPRESVKITKEHECDIFSGAWVRNKEAPYYTNRTCWAIHEHQNCMKYGRPDAEFMKWRWKPDGCELPVFNPHQFFEIVRDKSFAFVGDSVGRNHMQSLICLLSRVEYPVDMSETTDENFKRWYYKTYNFTLSHFFTPFLVKASIDDPNGPTHTGLFRLYLDEPDPSWSTKIDDFDYIILSAGHWFFRPLIYYQNNKLFGCRFCQIPNIKDYSMPFGYKRAFHTAFKTILSRENFKGVVYLRTYAPSHFEGGEWNNGGNCIRKAPYRGNEVNLDGINLDLYMSQIEEFRWVEKAGREKGMKFRLMDTTQAMLLRADGHPSRYGHWPEENVTLYNDCVHWCLPGPIDSWSDFLLEMMRTEKMRAKAEALLYGN